jgi:hypothetical protein
VGLEIFQEALIKLQVSSVYHKAYDTVVLISISYNLLGGNFPIKSREWGKGRRGLADKPCIHRVFAYLKSPGVSSSKSCPGGPWFHPLTPA